MTSCARADNHARRASLSCTKETARTQSLGRARFVLFQSNETDWTPVWTTWQDASCTTMSLHGMLDGAFPFKLSQGQTRSAVEIDKHIHTYFPVVSQHLGVPKYMRGKLVGDKVGLDAFFLEEEALISKCKLLWRRSLAGCILLYSSRNTPSCLSQVRRGDSRYCGTIWLLIAWECFENEQSNKLLKLHLDVTCNGIKLHSSYYWLQDDKVTAVFLATSLFAAPAELSSYDSTLLDGMVGICLHEDGLALSSEQKFGYCWRISTQALSILCFLPSFGGDWHGLWYR